MKQDPTIIPCDDLDAAIARYTSELGYRLDMIVPADSPVAAALSRDGEEIRLETNGRTEAEEASQDAWVLGRAGMMYRDLITGRLGGELVASHIRLTVGGEVPDYVHYHKVRFQVIYCVRGAIMVVYEDQGEPFWLKPGDCVLQPPEIRHRVLWAEEGSEVVELGIPAVHETWVEHDLKLPTAKIDRDRIFSGQRFVRDIAEHHAGQCVRDTGISHATNGLADVKVLLVDESGLEFREYMGNRENIFCFLLSGEVAGRSIDGSTKMYSPGEAFLPTEPFNTKYDLRSAEILLVGL